MTDIREICDLSDEDREVRLQYLRDGLMAHARGREELPDGLALFFDATQEMRDELDAFVAFEQKCCSSLGFTVRDTSDALRLEITGIDPGASVFADVGLSGVAPTYESEPVESGGWLRLVRSAGLGAIGAFVLFCLVPIGLVAVLGAQLAVPLGALDNPWVIGGGTLVFAGLLWRWERRREAARNAAGGCGC